VVRDLYIPKYVPPSGGGEYQLGGKIYDEFQKAGKRRRKRKKADEN